MDTKWKSIIRKIVAGIKKGAIYVFGFRTVLVGLFLFGYIYEELDHRYGLEVWPWVVSANVLLAIGVCIVIKRRWNAKYAEWRSEQENFYPEWKQKYASFERKLVITGIVMLVSVQGYFYWFYAGPGDTARFVGSVLVQFAVYYLYFRQLADKKMKLMMEEITEVNRRRIEEALKIERKSLERMSRSDKLRVELITNVSHDLKTPVTSIVGYLELIKKEELNDVVRDYIEVISERVDKLKQLIESLFSLAKASSGNIELHLEKFEVNRLLEQILADMSDKIEESKLEFVTQFTKESSELFTDNMYFYQICQNLIENALKYSAKETRVFIKTYVKEEKKLCMEITNTAGYRMDFDKEDVLERFARADEARSTEGNGLGLAIVSTYAKALGGEFDIQVDCDQFKAWLIFSMN